MLTPLAKKISGYSAAAVLTLFSACALFQYPQHHALDPEEYGRESVHADRQSARPDAEAYYRFGFSLQQRKKYKLSIEEFQAAVVADPGHAMAWNGLGVSWDALGEHAKAVEAYKAALRVDPRLDYALNNLGYSYLLSGNPRFAVEHFRQAIQLDSGNARYRNNLALALAEAGRHDEALVEFRQTSDEVAACRNIARICYRQGNYTQARQYYERASRKDTADLEIRKELRASRVLEKIFEEPATPAALEESGAQRYKIVEPTIMAAPAAEGPEAPARLLPVAEKPAVLEQTALPAAPVQERPSGVQAATATPERVRIEVLNGNGVRRMAKRVGDFLNGQEFKLMYLSNAGRFDHEVTQIYYADGYLPQANRLGERLPGPQHFECVPEVRGGNAEISILIGKDLVAISSFDRI